MSPERTPTSLWLQRVFRFGVTGILATTIHVGVAVLLITRLSIISYVANPIAFLFATCFAYMINTLWSFASRVSHRTLCRYVSVSVVSCVATAGVSAAANRANLDYRIGIALVIAIVTPLNFALHSLWTYRSIR